MLTSQLDRHCFRVAFVIVLTTCVISVATQHQSRAAADADAQSARDEIGADLEKAPTGYGQVPLVPDDNRRHASKIAGTQMQTLTLKPSRPSIHKRPAANDLATTQPNSIGPVDLPSAFKFRDGRAFLNASRSSKALRGSGNSAALGGMEMLLDVNQEVAAETPAASSTRLADATRNIFHFASRPPLSFKKPNAGVTQGLRNGASPSDHSGSVNGARGNALEVSSALPALPTASTTAPDQTGSSDVDNRTAASSQTKTGEDSGVSLASEPSLAATGSASFHDPKSSLSDKSTDTAAKITIKAEKRGFPFVNLQDGRELSVSAQETNTMPANVMASADFDSDGIADLVTAGRDGTLRFYRGNADSIYPNSPQAKQHKAEGTLVDSPFYPSEKSFSLGATPDFLEVGDFNGDGKKDVLALTKGDNRLQVMYGDGRGNFSAPATIMLAGKATALAVGEIGQADGQTDVAVAVQTDKGPQLLVFEHPEGAFKYKPEVIALPAPATDIALGNLDGDFYADIAVATGNVLTIVHGRGQAYPWDKIKQVEINRPPAIVATRTMPFSIAGLAIGEFGDQPGNSLAILSDVGSIHRLEPTKPKTSNATLPPAANAQTVKPKFLPTDVGAKDLALIRETPMDAESAKAHQMMVDSRSRPSINDLMQKMAAEAKAQMSKMSKEEFAQVQAAKAAEAESKRQLAKEAFLRAISAQPSTLSQWDLQPMVTDSGLHSSSSSTARKLIKARLSFSGKDDLVLLDSFTNQLHVVIDTSSGGNQPKHEVVSLDVTGSPLAVLPMRLNADALSDLVVLRNGAAQPSIVMTAPTSTFTVNDASDDNSSCGSGVACTLRGAIGAANLSPGSTITFDIPGAGVHTISPSGELPIVRNAVTIDGTTQPGFSGSPLIEIKGNNFQAGQAIDGLKIRASNCVVRGLAINEFPSFQDPNTGSLIGGNGLTSESTLQSPGVGHNTFEGNYLGTDPSGTLDKGNQATGLNIFDSSNNTIGGTTVAARNVISGNGTRDIRGDGLALTGANNNTIQGNYIGVDASGTQPLGNSEGMFLTGAGNQIGGDDAGAGNVISGNGEGSRSIGQDHCFGFGISEQILVGADNVTNLTLNNIVKGNKIGTNAAGSSAVGNCSQGIVTNTLTQMVIGSITENGRNVISGNLFGGIFISGFGNFFDNGQDYMGGYTNVTGNNIGTDVTGTVAVANNYQNGCFGPCFEYGDVTIFPGDEAFVSIGSPGGTTPGGACTGFCNLISGDHEIQQGQAGILGAVTRDFGGTVGIFNNYIGTDRTGTIALPNWFGVYHLLGDVGTTYIGTAVPANPGDPINLSLGNLISGNFYEAVSFSHWADGSLCQANLIGTDVSGNNAMGNSRVGQDETAIHLFSNDYPTFYLGGTDPLQRNVISGNNGQGINISGNIVVKNNYIGTNKDGTAPLPNLDVGVWANQSYLVSNIATIGGTEPGAANLIENNGGDGIVISGGGDPDSFDQIIGNTISNNGGAGIHIGLPCSSPFGLCSLASNNNQIGGAGDGEGNIIAHNAGPGVFVRDGIGNNIQRNSIHDNVGLGIDLSDTDPPDGVTTNDCLDADVGPNDLQNYPLLLAPVFNGDGTVTISGSLKAEPSNPHRIDFYWNTNADPTSYGQGENYFGSINVTTNGIGFASFTATSTVTVPNNAAITATATNHNGSTSEFSCAAGVCTGSQSLRDLQAQAATCIQPIVVNSTGDLSDTDPTDGICNTGGTVQGQPECTLRAAIQESNARGASGLGAQFITFAIPGSGVQTISPESALPDITSSVKIEGTSQPGYGETPVIELSGASAGNGVNGLRVTGGSADIRALAVNSFAGGNGIVLDGGVGGSHVLACFIGTNTAGTAQLGTMTNGVLINNSPGNLIGVGPEESGAYARNLLAGSSSNVTIQGSPSQQNTVAGNYFDLTVDAQTGLPNVNGKGITITNGAQNNNIGGSNLTAADQFNRLFSELVGIDITEGATGNAIRLNDVESCYIGIGIIRASNNTIGGDVDKSRNTIFNSVGGIYISDADAPPPPPPNTLKLLLSSGPKGIEARSSLVASKSSWTFRQPVGVRTSQALTTGNTVQGNLIGIAAMGANFSNVEGIVIGQASGNLIGGTTLNLRNLISFNLQAGIEMLAGGDNNTLQGNYIGLTPDGTGPAPNGMGVGIAGSNNTLRLNKISGNRHDGVLITNAPGDPTPTGNVLRSNLIGTNSLGTAPVPNGNDGVRIEVGNANQIGISGGGNLISGNGSADTPGSGVLIANAVTGNIVVGNRIGTDLNGAIAIGNTGPGITIEGSGNSISNNTVSGNFVGILIGKFPGDTSSPENNTVQGNRVGTNTAGSAAIPNTMGGIVLANGADNNLIGGLVDPDGNPATLTNGISNLGNLVSGNNGPGILINLGTAAGATPPFQNTIQGNLIGADATGTFAIPNTGTTTGTGIYIVDSPQNLVGGFGDDIPLARNIVSGNRLSGIDISGAGSSQNRISGNYIGTQKDGTSALGNGLGGVIFRSGAHHNMVGGPEPNAGNTIAFNKAGVVIFPGAGCCNSVDPNLTFSNEHLGIDLGCAVSPPDNGEVIDLSGCSGTPVPNDPGDGDSGPNNLQNYPEFSSAIINSSGDLILQYKVDSAPGNSNYGTDGIYVEFFKGDVSLQGQTFIGNTNYTAADYNNGAPGLATFNAGNAANLNIQVGDKIVATATDADGDTSEFTSVNIGVVASGSLSSTCESFSPAAGMGTINVSIAGNWTAISSDPSWLTITSGSPGSGNGVVSYSVAANPGANRRVATININGNNFTVRQGGTFTDVPSTHLFFTEIGELHALGITVGCTSTTFCPGDPVTREQMAAFIIRALGDFSPPPPASQRFVDVPPSNIFYPFIDEMAVRQITVGCATNPLRYCPSDSVTREQMAAFIIRALHEPGYTPPPPASQRFVDVPPENPFYAYIDELAARGITLGCSSNPSRYCPSDMVTRGQMAAFLVRAFPCR